jgi:acetyl esterase/lipase
VKVPPFPYPPEDVIEFLSKLRLPAGKEPTEVFAAQEGAMQQQPWPPVGDLYRRLEISHGGVELDADLVLPAAGAGWPVLLYVHGGGWEAGSPRTHRRIAHEFAARNFATLVPRYRLGPVNRHPAQLDDLDAAIGWARDGLAAYGADPTRIAVAGDSAGAHLAAAFAIRRKLAGREDLGAAVLLTGIFEYHDGLPLVGPDGWDGDPRTQPLLDPTQFESLRGDPVVNPLLGAAELPPSFVGAGSDDPFAGQSRRLFEALIDAGVPAELDRGEGLPHLWYLLPGLPEAAAGLDCSADWAMEQLG